MSECYCSVVSDGNKEIDFFWSISDTSWNCYRMKWNEAEMKMFLSSKAPDWEGRLCYKPPKRDLLQPVFKERYFKLIGNHDTLITNPIYCLKRIWSNQILCVSGVIESRPRWWWSATQFLTSINGIIWQLVSVMNYRRTNHLSLITLPNLIYSLARCDLM